MSLKAKITWGFVAMLALMLGLGAYAFRTVQRLDHSSRAILQDNFYSVQLGQAMLQDLDQAGDQPGGAGLAQFQAALTREAGNITEPGEQQLVDSMMAGLGRYQASGGTELGQLRRQTHRMVALNMRALTRKNTLANRTATNAGRLLLVLLTVGSLLALGLVLSVPEAAVGGLRKLLASIEHAAQGNFTASIPRESNDEFGMVTQAFNRLLVHLSDFRSANLADIITERNRLTSIVHTLDEGLLLLDENRRIIVANPVACQLLGLPEKQVLDRPAEEVAQENPVFRELLAYTQLPMAQRTAQPKLLTVGAGPTAAHFQLTVHEATSFNTVADKMEFVGSILALHNVSAFRKLDQTKSDFLATVSHELKTPLSTSNFNLKLLLDQRVGPLNAEQQDIVDHLKHENQRLLHLVAELLTVARLEAGAAIVLNQQPTDLATLVATATESLQLQLRPKHLVLDVQLSPNLPAVNVDLEKSAWVLLNLLGNAVRYSPEGGRIGLTAVATPDGQAVKVRVQDHGNGIPVEQQERIFERFVQVPGAPAPDTAAAGTGLGLSISREFITNQGGTLGVESTPGAGSTFYFTLPVA